MRSIALAVPTALAVLAVGVVPAGFAAKGGGGKPGEPPAPATLSVAPNPAPANGARVDITGCGYDFVPAEIRIVHSAGYTEAYMDPVWADGCLNPTYFLTAEAGTYTVGVYQATGNRRHPTLVLKASATLSVG
ncbi:MAG TPA: hypothetical protein VNJ53_00455 [Gaiellaceae bacterium]|nr:hypothetical protein [Gaiellaceae bacterium]